MKRTKTEHLDPTVTPKRILSLDGGGLRGRLTLEFLGVIESQLAAKSGDEELKLCDYFDLIGGTSTGAILAAMLACGATVNDLKKLYEQLGDHIFKPSFFRRGLLASKFQTEPLEKALTDYLKDTTLADERVRTGLMVMTKRLDTGSPWPLHNGPHSEYRETDGQLKLVDIVRASTAAPTYFEPQCIEIRRRNGTTEEGAFVDGGTSPFNDPSLQLLMVATLKGHGYSWKLGSENLLMVSVGTGVRRKKYGARQVTRWASAEQGLRSLQSLMDDCGGVNLGIMQWLTACSGPSWVINRALGDMREDSANGPKLARFSRYNVRLETEWCQQNLGLTYDEDKLDDLAQMDKPENLQELARIGAKAAQMQVRLEHLLLP
jgi:hypothetical protein